MESGADSTPRTRIMSDPYEILGLNSNATEDEVKKAYKTLAKKYHPDVTGNDPAAAKKMQEINAAYDAIMNHKETGSYYSSGSRSYGYSQGYDTDTDDASMEMQAAINYINARRYIEALTALSGIPENKRNARWYYLSAVAKGYSGDTQGARLDIARAISMEPNNMTYRAFQDRLNAGTANYRYYSNANYSRGSNAFIDCCLPTILLNLFCNCCC